MTNPGAVKDTATVIPAPAGPPDADIYEAPNSGAVLDGTINGITNGNANDSDMQEPDHVDEHTNGHVGSALSGHNSLPTDAIDSANNNSKPISPKTGSKSSGGDVGVDASSKDAHLDGAAANTAQHAQQNGHSRHISDSIALDGHATGQNDSDIDDQELQPTKRSKQYADLYPAQSGYAAQSGYGASDGNSEFSEDSEFSDMDVRLDGTDSDAQPEPEADVHQLPEVAHDNSHAVAHHTANAA